MRRPLFLAALLVAVCGGAFVIWRTPQSATSAIRLADASTAPPEAGPLCPWREPDSDLKAFFPQATRYSVETRILSGLRLELQQRLGRFPTGDENALRLNRAYQDDVPVGTILTRRVKGEHGAIELVLATDTNQAVCGVRLQRLREPDSIADALQDRTWQKAFIGKDAKDPWRIGEDIPDAPPSARASAAAVVDGARSLLILLAASQQAPSPTLAKAHHE